MSKLPDIASNLKCWRTFNKLAFGDNVRCPQCHHSLSENYQRKYLWCCQCRKKYRATAYKGSWLYGMKLTPRQFFLLLWCWQHKKSPDTARLLARASYTTVARWYARFRTQLPVCDELLSGVVQIDESYFGKQRSQQDQCIIVGAVEQTTGKVSLRITNSRSQDAIESFITDSIAPTSLVVSDKWYAYQELPLLGYDHESWNHSTGQFAGTNRIEGLWSVIKRYLRKLYGCIPTKHLESVLNEYTARLNRPCLFDSPTNYLRETLFHVS